MTALAPAGPGESDGVDLAGPRRVVEAHGGPIAIEGARRGGTTLRFGLPV